MNLYLCEADSLPEADYEKYKNAVSAETLAKAEKMRFSRDGQASVIGEGMIRFALGEEMNIPPEKIEILKTENGKPFVNGNIFFNISHSKGFVTAVTADSPVGVDIENIREPNYKTIKRFCTDDEEEYILSASDEAEKIKRYFTVWTLKEAYFKCTGEGILKGLKTAAFKGSVNAVSKKEYDFGTFYCLSDFIISYCVKKG